MMTSPPLSKTIYLWLIIFIFSPTFCLSHSQTADTSFPFIKPVAIVKGAKVILKPVIIADTVNQHLTFEWQEAIGNPAKVTIHQNEDGTANADIPDIKGEYYFILIVTKKDTTEKFETFITRHEKGLTAFDIESMKAPWIRKAIIYQITPYIFVRNGKYPDIEAKLPELADLGINTILLQPVFKSGKKGQGYDIIDFFSLREDLGTEAELQSLITTAKSLNLRVMFDIVPNHTSIDHPWAKDKIINGTKSPYYNYYQQSNDGAPYSSHYHEHPEGFIYYFWKDLVNLNYKNEEVQKMMIDACKYWVRKFDIDGYRFDAVWAVNARAPLFGKRLQLELKSIKPDLFLLAEDKASPGAVYKQGFDAAYDWTKDTNWVSQWSWQYEYDKLNHETIFNHPSIASRKELLREALFGDGDSIGLRLRYLENNDLHRFISNHPLNVTKMAATLLFSLPGLPMLYNGQEIAFTEFPYRSGPIFQRDKSIRSLNPEMFDFYKHLILIRKKNNVLVYGTMKEITLTDGPGAIAFLRSTFNEDVLVIINMTDSQANLKLKLDGLKKLTGNKVSFTDFISGDKIIVSRKGKNTLLISVNAYTTKLLMFNK